MRDFGDEVFAGTAKYYAKYRAPYPPEIFADIARIFNLDGTGRLLDLGCGTGELAIPLAKYFEQVLAIDPDAGMLIEARKKATAHKTLNIKWAEGSSRTLLSSVEGKFRLAVMGQSVPLDGHPSGLTAALWAFRRQWRSGDHRQRANAAE
jgi:precorrin-6B methylase 2